MLGVVSAVGSELHRAVWSNMHSDRKRVFVDQLKWDVPVVEECYEIDQFDDEHAHYIVVTGENGTDHLGSVRLLPSTRPHILGSIFPSLCAGEVPTGENVWEITRLCISPEVRRRAQSMEIRRKLAIAIVEFGLLRGIDRFTLVTNMGHVPALLALGWDCEPLGLPQPADGVMIGALVINISTATLRMLLDQQRNAEKRREQRQELAIAA
jgi:N-acyl-L-homoserine lactone synthetase